MARKNLGSMLAFLMGGTLTTAAISTLDPGPFRAHVMVLGILITVLGCMIGLVATRRTADRHAEEVASLRNELYVERLDGREREARIGVLERELSVHSVALARLLERN